MTASALGSAAAVAALRGAARRIGGGIGTAVVERAHDDAHAPRDGSPLIDDEAHRIDHRAALVGGGSAQRRLHVERADRRRGGRGRGGWLGLRRIGAAPGQEQAGDQRCGGEARVPHVRPPTAASSTAAGSR